MITILNRSLDIFLLSLTASLLVESSYQNFQGEALSNYQDGSSIPDKYTLDPEDEDTDKIPVNIKLDPVEYLGENVYIPTNLNLTAKAEILSDRFKNLSITYQWSTKNRTIITDTNASQIVVKFDKPDEKELLRLIVFYKPNITGSSERKLIVRDPVNILDPKDKLFLEHGELLNVRLTFTGTGPFRACYRFCFKTEHCPNCEPEPIQTNNVNITHYLRHIGNHALLFIVDNVASRQIKHYSVRIIENTRVDRVPYVPVVCSILAVLILLVGTIFHLKSKEKDYTETADFEFLRNPDDDEEWDEVQSFSQRIRYLLLKDRYQS